MKTQEALDRFLKECEERGLAPLTREKYAGYLRHFAEEHPELPTDTITIEKFLKKRKETPTKRGNWYKKLQAFYSFIWREYGIPSPVPPKGKVGRPPQKLVTIQAQSEGELFTAEDVKKLVTGGQYSSDSTSISTEEVINSFLTQRKLKNLHERTFQVYSWVFKPFLAKFHIFPLKPEPIEEFLGSLQMSPESRHIFFRTLRALYRFTCKRRKLTNPFEDISLPAPKRKVRPKLSREQFHDMMQLPMSFHDRAMLALIADTGARAGDLINAKQEDISSGYITFRGIKGDERVVPISQETEDMLLQLTSSGYLFHGSKGRLHYTYLHRLIRRLLDELGVKDTKKGPHMLRHSFAPLFLEGGGDIQSLKQILGHSKITTTEIYSEELPTQVKSAHRKATPLHDIMGSSVMERARCFGCNTEVVLETEKVKETKCPGCGQVGYWYLPDKRTGVRPE